MLEVSAGRLIGVLPQKGHPVSNGSLCVKGWTSHEFVESKRRLTKPLLRREGELKQVSWEEAIAALTDKLREAIESGGPDSAAVICSAKCTNEENYLANKLARAVIGTNNIDHCARL